MLVEQSAAGDVDQVQAGLGLGQHLAVDQPSRGRGERCGDDQMIAACEQLLQAPDALDTGHLGNRLARAVQRQYLHPQCAGLARQALANAAEAEDTQGAAAQRRQGGQAPVGIVHPQPRQLLGGGKDQGQGEFCDLLGIGALATGDRWPLEYPVRVEIDA
ncbi:hypothetical protein D3C81_1194660 [compost metagenome]